MRHLLLLCLACVFAPWTGTVASPSDGADIVFVIDASGRVGEDNFKVVKQWLESFARGLKIGLQYHQLSFLSYGNSLNVDLTLGQSTDVSRTIRAIKLIKYQGGAISSAGPAMAAAKDQAFSAFSGGRSDRVKIIVNVGAGGDTVLLNFFATQAQEAVNSGKVLFNVAIGSAWSEDLLNKASSAPRNHYTLQAASYSDLNGLTDTLRQRILDELPKPMTTQTTTTTPPTTPTPTPQACPSKSDVVFALDGSGSIGPHSFLFLKDKLKAFIATLPVSKDGFHLGILQFSSRPKIEFLLNRYFNRTEIGNAIDDIAQIGYGTRIDLALESLSSMFSRHLGAREGVSRVGILVTDGKSKNVEDTKQLAQELRNQGINILVVGIGSGIATDELEAIAGDPSAVHILKSYNDFQDAEAKIMAGICQAVGTIPPPTSPTTIDPSTETCLDKSSQCASYVVSEDNYCQKFKTHASENCQRTCGFCTTVIPPTIPPCVDVKDDCSSHVAESCVEKRYTVYYKSSCRQYCGFCDPRAKTRGLHGRCTYKGKTYSNGDSWTDGCDYECTCTDAEQGMYSCFNRCPVYYDLPPDCTLVKKEGECCLKPACNFKRTVTSFEKLVPAKDKNGKDVCEYNGTIYRQNQVFRDGCQYQCQCIDAAIGTVRCSSLCPTFASPLPSICRMVKDDGACCPRLVCELTSTVGKFIGRGTTTGKGVYRQFIDPKKISECKDSIDCSRIVSTACTEDRYRTYMFDNCPVFCNICKEKYNPQPKEGDRCYFNGKAYKDGDVWEADCRSTCACDNTYYGYYRCYDRCPDYDGMPQGCQKVTLPGQCCPQIECNGTIFYWSTINLKTRGGGRHISHKTTSGTRTSIVPSFRPDGTLDPQRTGTIPPSLRGCLFNGRVLAKEEIGTDGKCGAVVCTCLDDTNGRMSCVHRCANYRNDSSCTMVTDPRDPCCQVPSCPSTIPAPLPQYPTPKTVFEMVKPPDLTELTHPIVYPTFPPDKIPDSVLPLPTFPPDLTPDPSRGSCEFLENKKTYMEGERWSYKCKYNCICINGTTGHYVCNSMCKTCPEGLQCTSTTDPDFPCCKLFQIVLPTLPDDTTTTTPPQVSTKSTTLPTTTTTPPSIHVSTTPSTPHFTPPTYKFEYCDYKGKKHSQGSSWFPSCQEKCTCVDASSNQITCSNRCPVYNDLPSKSTCVYTEDPNDSCCKVPVCSTSSTAAPNQLKPPSLPNGEYEATAPPGANYCQYNGRNYKQDEEWAVGCDYVCRCINQLQRRHSCHRRCTRYDMSRFPPVCRLITDPKDTCCKKAVCDLKYINGGIDGRRHKHHRPMSHITVGPDFNLRDLPQCVYNGKHYYQGNEWNEDGCNRKCRCDDAVNNIVSCQNRCPTMVDSPGCVIVADPLDTCCKKQKCPVSKEILIKIGPLDLRLIPTRPPQHYIGQHERPTPLPGHTLPPPLNKCVYKGQNYDQGESWFDGCDLRCSCIQASKGKYKCQTRCSQFPELLPKQCKLFPIPGDACCKQLDCSQSPGRPVLTPPPTSDGLKTTTPLPTIDGGIVITPPIKQPVLCEDKGKYFTAGQMWFIDCDLKCFCQSDGSKRCESRCKSFPSPPEGQECTLIPDPQDSTCCQVPRCKFTVPPTNVPTGGRVLPSVVPRGTYTGYGKPKLDKNRDGNEPDKTPKCSYKDKEYPQGETWTDGCERNCECVNGKTGKYTCTQMCDAYPDLPSDCFHIRDRDNPCCVMPYCPDNNSMATETSPPPLSTNPPSKCVYNGYTYRDGESWQDGCDYICFCDLGSVGKIRCERLCSEYKNVDPSCTWKTDEYLPCCRFPVCPLKVKPTADGVNKTQAPVPVPVGQTGIKVGQRVDPGEDTDEHKRCEYKGKKYRTQEKWTDGKCGLKCTCLNEESGHYECHHRCPTYNTKELPYYCQMGTDPDDACCQKPICHDPKDISGHKPEPHPTATQVVPEPTKFCTYKNRPYLKNQAWFDGCDLKCKCEETSIGMLSNCVSRCRIYGKIPASCSLVTDPSDSECCKIVSCIPPIDSTGSPFVITNVPPGVIHGQVPGGKKTQRCLYKGSEYRTGQAWKDGCSRECTCQDQTKGYYTCKELCPKYAWIPAQCSLRQDPANVCCQLLHCDPSIPVGKPQRTDPPPRTLPPAKSTMTPDPSLPQTARPIPTRDLKQHTQPTVNPRPSHELCLYNGAAYKQNDEWNLSCSKKCRCEHARSNTIKCFDRCPHFPDDGLNCIIKVNPADPCCKIRHCLKIPHTVIIVGPKPSKPSGKILVPKVIPKSTFTGTNPDARNSRNDGHCTYKGRRYKSHDTWNDGCGLECTCIDPTNDKVTCQEKCVSYVDVPSNCAIGKDKDGCCDTATCYNPNQVHGRSTQSPPGSVSNPTLAPPYTSSCHYKGVSLSENQIYFDDGCREKCTCVDASSNFVQCIPRCLQYQEGPTCELVPDPKDPKCCKVPLCGPQHPKHPIGHTGTYKAGGKPQPPSNELPYKDACYAQKQFYKQDEQWQGECEICKCVEAANHQYECTSMCPSYPALPPYCDFEYDKSNPCCQRPSCFAPVDEQTYCVYEGIAHKQGDHWTEGCSTIFSCEDSATNTISQIERCAKPIPKPGCRIETDPTDKCCQIVVCVNATTDNSWKVLTVIPGHNKGKGHPPKGKNPLSRNPVGCYVNRKIYRQGQSWSEGCSFTCTCTNEIRGDFRCDQRCAPIPHLPPSCELLIDPHDKCCLVPHCIPSKLLQPDVITASPPPLGYTGTIPKAVLKPSIEGVCLHKGQYYRELQMWYEEDCGPICMCENATDNIVRCTDACATITRNPDCLLVPDPTYPRCCHIEDCPEPVPEVIPPPGFFRPKVRPRVVHGGLLPHKKPEPPVGGCLYKGNVYKEKLQFMDECEYICECLNGSTGEYRCQSRCPVIIPRKECILVEDPQDKCCQIQYCDFFNKIPFHYGVPDSVVPVPPKEVRKPSPYVVLGRTPFHPTNKPGFRFRPPLGSCYYDGAQYLQGELWNDRCEKKCSCTNGAHGYYSCADRCPSYGEFSPNCTLRTSPEDSCCLIQECPIPNLPIDPPSANTSVTVPPSKPKTYIKQIIIPKVKGPKDNVHSSKSKCVTESKKSYNQGESWETHDENCTCIDAALNKALCTERCPNYYFLPSTCSLTVDPNNEPCLIATCPVGSLITPVPYTHAQVFPSQPVQINRTPPTLQTPEQCIYTDSQKYNQSETWMDGCQQCQCLLPAGNQYQCTRTCRAYGGLPDYCTLADDPSDSCCQKPKCEKGGIALVPVTTGKTKNPKPTVDPRKTNIIPIITHPVTTGTGHKLTTTQTELKEHGGVDACVYKDIIYSPGETWMDGCSKSCACEKNARGHWTCLDICGEIPPLPSYCQKKTVPGDCCTKIVCDIPKVGPYVPETRVKRVIPGQIPKLVPGTRKSIIIRRPPTDPKFIVPGNGFRITREQAKFITNRCIRDYRAYKSGDTWNEGCDIECQCIDENSGYFECKNVCPIYSMPSPRCVLTTIEGQCCHQAICNDPDTGFSYNPILHPKKNDHIYTIYKPKMSGFRSGYNPSGLTSKFIGCYFNNQLYQEGQGWTVGCSMQCTCVSGKTHTIECRATCNTYSNIPSHCSLVSSSNPCCEEIKCPHNHGVVVPTPVHKPGFNLTEGECFDTNPHCDTYTVTACGPQYATWIKQNCPRFCGLCPGSILATHDCRDKSAKCSTYGQKLCQAADSKLWMWDNCYKTCGYCDACTDIDESCSTMDRHFCLGVWGSWAKQMCAKTCNYCFDTPTTTKATVSENIPTGWTLLMKAINGISGELYKLWHSTGALNPNDPLVQKVTASYGANFKSYFVDHLDVCQFEKVKVALYTGGIEKGYIVFNSTGAIKDTLFEPSRILESLWSDMNNRVDAFFLRQNLTTGREFLFGSDSTCVGSGWMFISTAAKCGFQNGENTIYYSDGNRKTSYSSMKEADVFLIMGSGGKCDGSTTLPQTCPYRNRTHFVGDTWKEGCDVECHCQSLNKTFTEIACQQLCSTYTSLPAGCQAVKRPGECCESLVGDTCHSEGKCIDGLNKTRNVGEKWREGCKYKCECSNEGDQYTSSCKGICPVWPAGILTSYNCTAGTPRPGKCCAIPSCPIHIDFTIPPEYKNEF